MGQEREGLPRQVEAEPEDDGGPVHPRGAVGRRRDPRGDDGRRAREGEMAGARPRQGPGEDRQDVRADRVRERRPPSRVLRGMDAALRQALPVGTIDHAGHEWKIWNESVASRPLRSRATIVTTYEDAL